MRFLGIFSLSQDGFPLPFDWLVDQEQLSKLSPVKEGCISVKDWVSWIWWLDLPPNRKHGIIPEMVKVSQGEGETNCVAMTSICWKTWVFFWLFRTCLPVSAAKMEVAMRRGDIRHTRQGIWPAVVSGWNIYFIDLSKRKPFAWKYVKFKKCWELQFNLHEFSIHPPPGSGSSSLLEPGI